MYGEPWTEKPFFGQNIRQEQYLVKQEAEIREREKQDQEYKENFERTKLQMQEDSVRQAEEREQARLDFLAKCEWFLLCVWMLVCVCLKK